MTPLVITTGTSKGLGRAFVDESLRRNFLTVGLARSPSPLIHKGYTHYELDVGDERACASAMLEIKEKVESVQVGKVILIANAGEYISVPLEDLTLSDVRRAIESNYLTYVSSVLGFTRAFSSGTIVGIAGYNSIFTSPKSAAYGSAKRALVRFADSLKQELPREQYRTLTIMAHTINTWSDERVSGAMDRFEIARLVLDLTTSYDTLAAEELILTAAPDAK